MAQDCMKSNSFKNGISTSTNNHDQTGFLKERYFGQNIWLSADIFESTKLQEITGILLLLDFKNAFDSIEWRFIQRTIYLFNFGSNIKRWITTIYANTVSAVFHNRYTTNYFKLSRGVWQGCPLFPSFYIWSRNFSCPYKARGKDWRNNWQQYLNVFKKHSFSQKYNSSSQTIHCYIWQLGSNLERLTEKYLWN